jgi:uncharacterized membrane protein
MQTPSELILNRKIANDEKLRIGLTVRLREGSTAPICRRRPTRERAARRLHGNSQPQEVNMRTPAQIAGHPIHPMLVTLPIGLWVFSLVADLIALGSSAPDTWRAVALYTMIGGIIGALAAAIPGLIDLLSLRDLPVQRTAIKHMALNLTIVALYAINAWLRLGGAVAPDITVGLSVLAVALLLVSGWLGGKMVYEAGVGVHADEATMSAERRGSERAGSWGRQAPAAGAGMRDNRAMAADSERPSRQPGESPRE